MSMAASTRTLPFAIRNSDDATDTTPQAVEIDPRHLSSHMLRDLGIIDVEPSAARRRDMFDFADVRAGWL